MLKQFLNHISHHKLFEKSDRVLLAVSGGVDSMVMLHLFLEAKFQVSVAHCNFQLRGKDSDGDEEFVFQTCNRLNVPVFCKRFDTQAYALENKLSTQMAARELRYSWFDHIMDENRIHFLATGHHVNDSIETILLNWIHGSDIYGLSGIPLKNSGVIRPMLFATREEIERYAKGKEITWREDQSNLTDDYQRNFIRHNVVPKLKELNPSLESTLYRGQRKIKDELDLIEDYIGQWLADHFRMKDSNILVQKKAIVNASLLWRVIRSYGFNFDQCEDILAALEGQSGKRFLSPSHQLTIDREHLIISPHENFWNDVFINEGQSKALLGSWSLEITKMNSAEFSKDSLMAILDGDKLKFPLRWRKWKAGDFFYPLGMEHKRKLSDFLIDNKVSLADKNVVTVLESAGEIAWVVGYRIDNRFKITPQTRSALSFSIQPYFV